MKISDYTYDLPDERIAQFPPEVRGSSRLLVLDKVSGSVTHHHYYDLHEFIEPGDLVILNDTRVIKARLLAVNANGQPRELLLLEEHAGSDPYKRRVMYRGAIHKDEQLSVGKTKITISDILDGGLAIITSEHDLLALAELTGKVPLPPYMRRDATKNDTERYQTVFANLPGSVAAPTASLNFTHELEKKIIAKGGKIAYLTLHVGLGTFLPIRADNIEDHIMHSEYFEIPKSTAMAIRQAKNSGRKILAVGTTVARTLEYVAKSQNSPLLRVKPLTDEENVISGEANIFIYPGYEFKIVDTLLTNFHAPKSTVLMLTAAFAGWPNLEKAYKTAIQEKYAFLSYGDSMLII